MTDSIPILTIDGPSGAGKGTISRAVANRLGWHYLDSGALYRGVTLFALEQGLIAKDGSIDEKGLEAALPDLVLDFRTGARKGTFLGERCVEQEIRTLEVSEHVSPISAIPFVRAFVDKRLHAFGRRKRVVMDGRDIGTVVFPNAEVKFFMTASPEVRAQRRYLELKGRGAEITIEEVAANIERRDLDDTTRVADPLTQAADAFVIDNTHLTSSEQFNLALGEVVRAIGVVTEA